MRLGRRSTWIAGVCALLVLSTTIAEAKPAKTYRVKSGDTLSHIAMKKLGKARKWVPLYRMNRKVVGPNPHRIYPGQVLVLVPGEAAAKTPSVSSKPSAPVAVLPPELPVLEAPVEPEVEPMPVGVDPAPVAVSEPEPMSLQPEPQLPETGANPWIAAGASTLFPGAGQAVNGDWTRSALFAGAALALYGTGRYAMTMNDAALSRASGIALLGVSLAAPIDAYFGVARPPRDARKEAQR